MNIEKYSVIFETFRMVFDLVTLSLIIRYFYYFVGKKMQNLESIDRALSGINYVIIAWTHFIFLFNLADIAIRYAITFIMMGDSQ